MFKRPSGFTVVPLNDDSCSASSSVSAVGNNFQDVQRNQLELARRYQKSKKVQAKVELDPEEKKRIELVMATLAEKIYHCEPDCACSWDMRALQRGTIKTLPDPPKRVISHNINNGILHLFCLMTSESASPRYMRYCQVPFPQRYKYRKYLKKHGRPPIKRKFWNKASESQARRSSHPELSPSGKRMQMEIVECLDTNEWVEKTNNGRKPMAGVKSSKIKKQVGFNDRLNRQPEVPQPKENNTDEFDVEGILGVRKIGNSKIIEYFVKWKGYEEPTWEPQKNLINSSKAVNDFHHRYGFLNTKKCKIMAPGAPEVI